ncbi:MORN repeat-containing protein [Nonlabens agnitus]|uniref:Phosphatidylinositol-4-phosphate 5-kinase n=1 Tax=Nonlabens agnitus TaxID=870484 RepID=A0A2S9WXG4_9FLAO|nr:hypothetical protein [Nonlabens agnitus]PRP68141.1 hypothetical protein BST86_14100 [Nonlabens agnitus]
MKRIFPYILVLLTATFAFYQYNKSENLKEELAAGKQEENTDLDLNQKKVISRTDSLLEAGNYEQALENLDQFTTNYMMDRELRRSLGTRMLAMQNQLKYRSNPSEPIDATAAVTPSEQYSQQEIDSLSFALAKAQMQLKNIQTQMQQKLYGEYLTFKSAKGNRLHYVGQVKRKKANGYGIAILDSGSRYEGEWHNGLRHGNGTFYWIDGEHYEGEYVNDVRSGLGTYYWTNGEKFVGSWDNDLRNGKGKFYDKDGNIIASGTWKDDKLIEER